MWTRGVALIVLAAAMSGLGACQPAGESDGPVSEAPPIDTGPVDDPIAAEDLPPDEAIPAEEEVPPEVLPTDVGPEATDPADPPA